MKTHSEALHSASDACPMRYFVKDMSQYIRCGASSDDFETMLAAYLEARGAVLVPEKMTMPMLNAVMKAHRSLPASKQTIAASTEYQTAELVWDAALSALSDNPKGETHTKTNDESRLSDVEKVVSALLADPYPRTFIAGSLLTEDEAKRLNQAIILAKEYIWNMGGAVA